MWHVSANRDENVFDDPDTFDIERSNANEQVGFGLSGAHRLGNQSVEQTLKMAFRR